MEIPVISFIARSGTGKTTLIEKLIRELKERGYRVATIKHHSHVGFDIDVPGKDSWRFAQACSDHVIVASPDKIASYRKLEEELDVYEIVKPIMDVDIILVEGYRKSGLPAIQIIRQETGTEIFNDVENLIAIVSDVFLKTEVPQLNIMDSKTIVDFLVEKYL